MQAFLPADILMPRVDSMEKWAVIACDQFSSQPAYWERVRETAGDAPSTINLILPEAELGTPQEARSIPPSSTRPWPSTSKRACSRPMPVPLCMWSARWRAAPSARVSLVWWIWMPMIILPAPPPPSAPRRKTVVERIPPRMRVRKDAPIELPHILMLCDDHDKVLIEPSPPGRRPFPSSMTFELMEAGGHITGWLVQGKAVDDFEARLADYTAHVGEKYTGLPGVPMVFAVGDGNHSLATAKACFMRSSKKAHPGEDLSSHPARFALVELENIHDEAQVFEPIHRVITHTDPSAILKAPGGLVRPRRLPGGVVYRKRPRHRIPGQGEKPACRGRAAGVP